MSYRDNLAAAQARADAAMKSLADERESREDDATYLAELERTLAASLQELAGLREEQEREEAGVNTPAPAPVPPAAVRRKANTGLLPVYASVLLLVLGGGLYFLVSEAPRNDTSYEYAEQVYDEQAFAVQAVEAVPMVAITEFDVTAGLSQASTLASTHFGDDVIGTPYLVRIQATAVDEQGLSHLEYGDVTYRYVVKRPPLPDSVEPPSTAPLGTRPPDVVEPDTRSCYVDIIVDQHGMRIHSANQPPTQFPLPDMMGLAGLPDINRQHSQLRALLTKMDGSCDQAKLENPCPIGEIRQAAVALGAPKDALASVSIGNSSSKCNDGLCAKTPEALCCIERRTNWQIQIVDRGEILFYQLIANQCEPPADSAPNPTE
ncbi:MAG: hypothetical protein JKY56_08510 [Kofleriaceae bacterium]|nr:hypothetical protein [Kofleriaceae bacterium]